MDKDEFIKELTTKGYDTTNENGVVMVKAPVEKLWEVHDAMVRLAKKNGYDGSFGVRLGHGTTDR